MAAVLCGGFGTRLRAVIGEHQKCAVDIGGRPWIQYLLDELDRVPGIDRVLLLTGYRPQEIERAAHGWAEREGPLARHAPRNVKIEFLHSTPAGPEAAIETAFAWSGETEMLVLNGDTLVLGFDVGAFVEEARGPRVSLIVRAPSLLTGAVSDAGISYQRRPIGLGLHAIRIEEAPFLDIGSPEGLAEARRRCLS